MARLVDLLPDSVRTQYPDADLTPKARKKLQLEIPPEFGERDIPRLRDMVLKRLPRWTIASQSTAAPSGQTFEAYRRFQALTSRAGQFGAGYAEALPSHKETPYVSGADLGVPPAKGFGQKLVRGLGGLAAYATVIPPLVAGAAALGAPTLAAGAIGAGLASAGSAGRWDQRLVRGGLGSAGAAGAGAVAGAVGRATVISAFRQAPAFARYAARAGKSVEPGIQKAVATAARNKAVAGAAAGTAAFGVVNPSIEVWYERLTGHDVAPITIQDLVENIAVVGIGSAMGLRRPIRSRAVEEPAVRAPAKQLPAPSAGSAEPPPTVVQPIRPKAAHSEAVGTLRSRLTPDQMKVVMGVGKGLDESERVIVDQGRTAKQGYVERVAAALPENATAAQTLQAARDARRAIGGLQPIHEAMKAPPAGSPEQAAAAKAATEKWSGVLVGKTHEIRAADGSVMPVQVQYVAVYPHADARLVVMDPQSGALAAMRFPSERALAEALTYRGATGVPAGKQAPLREPLPKIQASEEGMALYRKARRAVGGLDETALHDFYRSGKASPEVSATLEELRGYGVKLNDKQLARVAKAQPVGGFIEHFRGRVAAAVEARVGKVGAKGGRGIERVAATERVQGPVPQPPPVKQEAKPSPLTRDVSGVGTGMSRGNAEPPALIRARAILYAKVTAAQLQAQKEGLVGDAWQARVKVLLDRAEPPAPQKREPKAGTAVSPGKTAERKPEVPAPVVGAKAEVVRRGAAPLAPAVEAPTPKKAAEPTRAARGGKAAVAEPKKPAAKTRGIAAFHERETSMGTKLREEWRVRQLKTPADHDAARALVGPHGRIDGPFAQERRYIRDGVEEPWEFMDFHTSKAKALEAIHAPKATVVDPQLAEIREARVVQEAMKAQARLQAETLQARRDEMAARSKASNDAFVRMKGSPKTAKMAEEWNAEMQRMKPRAGELAKDPEFMRRYTAAMGATTVPSKAKAMRLLLEYARAKETTPVKATPKQAAKALTKAWDGIAKGEEGKIPIGEMFDAIVRAAVKHELNRMEKKANKPVPPEVTKGYAKATGGVTKAENDFWDRVGLGVTAGRMAKAYGDAGKLYHSVATSGGELLSKHGGWAGEVLADGMDKWLHNSDRRGSKLSVDLAKRVDGMKKEQLEAIGRRLGGIGDPTTGVEQAVAETRQVLDDIIFEAEERGLRERLTSGDPVPIRRQENYFPQQVRRDLRRVILKPGHPAHEQQIAFMMERNPAVDRAQAVRELRDYLVSPDEFAGSGGMQHERRMVLHPDLREWNVLRVLPRYFMTSTRRLERARFFGPQDEIAKQLVWAIAQEGKDGVSAQIIFDHAVDPRPTQHAGLVRFTTDVAVVSFLTTAGIAQYSQLANTIALAGFKNTIRGVIGVATSKALRRQVEATGATARNIVHEFVPEGTAGGLAEKWSKFIRLEANDRQMRLVSGAAGLYFAPEMARQFFKNQNNAVARRRIEALGLDPAKVIAQQGKLSGAQLSEAAQRLANQAQFAGYTLDLPPTSNEWLGRIMWIFKKFAFQQGRFNKRLVKDAIAGDAGSLLRYLAVIPAVAGLGELTRELRSWLSGKKRKPPRNLFWRALEDVMLVQAFGTFGDLLVALSRGKGALMDFSAGPAISEIYRLGPEAWDAVVPQADKDRRGIRLHPHKLVRHVLSRLPGMGQRVADWLAPEPGAGSKW